jgi:hypothetical protein
MARRPGGTADHRVIGLPCSVGKSATQAEIGLLRCAALPGTLGPWPLRSWHLEPEREPLRDIWDSHRTNSTGHPNAAPQQTGGRCPDQRTEAVTHVHCFRIQFVCPPPSKESIVVPISSLQSACECEPICHTCTLGCDRAQFGLDRVRIWF